MQQSVAINPETGATTLIFAVLILTLLVHTQTAYSMVAIWYQSETFAHGFFIVPISMYLIWRKRNELNEQQIRQNYWILFPLVATGLAWLAADMVDVTIVKQFSLIAMLVQVVWLILGTNVLKTILFPLLFLFLAVPAGEGITPALMTFTAKFTVWAIQVTGIPIYREGMYFTIPSGNFEVAKACSGIRYLTASVTVGMLYAYMNFQSYRRRIVFICIAIIIPILANGIRAYLIVMIAHLSDLQYAVGADHLVYGWVFFGFVVFALLFIGRIMSEDEALSDEEIKNRVTTQPINWKQVAIAIFLAAVSVAVFPSISQRMENSRYVNTEEDFTLPSELSGWRKVSQNEFIWKPYYVNASHEIQEIYIREGEFIGIHIALYSQQEQGAELINEQNKLVRERGPRWRIISTGGYQLSEATRLNSVLKARLKSVDQEILVWRWYLVNGIHTKNQYIAKFQEVFAKLRGIPVSMGITLYTDSGQQSDDASRRLNRFLKGFTLEVDKSFSQINNSADS